MARPHINRRLTRDRSRDRLELTESATRPTILPRPNMAVIQFRHAGRIVEFTCEAPQGLPSHLYLEGVIEQLIATIDQLEAEKSPACIGNPRRPHTTN